MHIYTHHAFVLSKYSSVFIFVFKEFCIVNSILYRMYSIVICFYHFVYVRVGVHVAACISAYLCKYIFIYSYIYLFAYLWKIIHANMDHKYPYF